MATPEWLRQNGYARMATPEWLRQNGYARMATPEWLRPLRGSFILPREVFNYFSFFELCSKKKNKNELASSIGFE